MTLRITLDVNLIEKVAYQASRGLSAIAELLVLFAYVCYDCVCYVCWDKMFVTDTELQIHHYVSLLQNFRSTEERLTSKYLLDYFRAATSLVNINQGGSIGL